MSESRSGDAGSTAKVGTGSATPDDTSTAAWKAFLTHYTKGNIGAEAAPDLPPLPPGSFQSRPSPFPPNLGERPLYSYISPLSDTDVRIIRDFYCRHHYLTPPRSPHERERHACIADYNLLSAKQVSNIRAATEVIADFFPGTICSFTLFNDAVQETVSLSAEPETLRRHRPSGPGFPIVFENSLCGHAVLHDSELFLVSNLEQDWRFAQNPYTLLGYKSYVGSAVSLQVNPLHEVDSTRIVIGTLNVCFVGEPIEDLTAAQRRVIKHVTAMLETQLRATWEGDQRTKEGRARVVLSELIEEALVDIEADQEKGRANLRRVADSAVEKLCEILPDIDSIVLLDSGGVPDQGGSFIADIGESCETLASAGQPLPAFPQETILTCLNNFRHPRVFQPGQEDESGLESHLPESIRSHLVLPLRAADRPFYLIVACSSEPHYSFPPIDINIIRAVGSILRAKAFQHRVMLADAAKTSFLSSISHELRTPMHGVKAAMELIRHSANTTDWAQRIGPLSQVWEEIEGPLSLAESSGRALLNILNDVLDFGKNDWAKAEEGVVDLAKSAEEIASVCLAYYGESMGDQGTVRLEYEDRDWRVEISEARYQRIIINGLTNAMKFCPQGNVVISLRAGPDGKGVVIEVQDNGSGIDEEALPRLMQPFTKMDAHSPGAGLGLYITKSLVKKMGGDLALRSVKGEGTTFCATLSVILPVRDDSPIKMINRDLRVVSMPSNSNASDPAIATTNGNGSSSSSSSSSQPQSFILPSSLKRKAPDDDLRTPLKVLIVDDNELCRKILRMAMKRAPMPIELQEAENGQTGLELFQSFRPDVVFTDVSMPVMDGVTAAGRMRELLQAEEARTCRIYAITGLGSADPRTQSIGVNGKAALDGWLIKGKDMLAAVYEILTALGDTEGEWAVGGRAVRPKFGDADGGPL